MCDCGCAFLICDFTFLFFKCLSEMILGKQPNLSIIFLIRCFIGLVFDVTEYGILTATADDIDHDRFKTIFIVYAVFIVVISELLFLFNKEAFLFFFEVFFKCISLSVAISIFTTTSHFEWDTIETSFVSIDSAEDFFTAMLIFVSFVDICLNLGVLGLKKLFIFLKTVGSEKNCCEAFSELVRNSSGQHRMDD